MSYHAKCVVDLLVLLFSSREFEVLILEGLREHGQEVVDGLTPGVDHRTRVSEGFASVARRGLEVTLFEEVRSRRPGRLSEWVPVEAHYLAEAGRDKRLEQDQRRLAMQVPPSEFFEADRAMDRIRRHQRAFPDQVAFTVDSLRDLVRRYPSYGCPHQQLSRTLYANGRYVESEQAALYGLACGVGDEWKAKLHMLLAAISLGRYQDREGPESDGDLTESWLMKGLQLRPDDMNMAGALLELELARIRRRGCDDAAAQRAMRAVVGAARSGDADNARYASAIVGQLNLRLDQTFSPRSEWWEVERRRLNELAELLDLQYDGSNVLAHPRPRYYGARVVKSGALAAVVTLVFLLLGVFALGSGDRGAFADDEAPVIPHDRSDLPVVPHDVVPRGTLPGLRPFLAAIPHDLHEDEAIPHDLREDEVVPHDIRSRGGGREPTSLLS